MRFPLAHSRARKTALIAMSLALSVVAAACGSSEGSGGNAEPENTTDVSTGDTGDTGATDTSATTTPEDDLEPVPGGQIAFAIEAETATGFAPPSQQCAASCHTEMLAMFDPLTYYDAEGNVVPFLLESYESNADFTEWTLTMRPGITFHDGTPADGAALKRHFDEMLKGAITALVLQDVTAVEQAGDLGVKITLGLPNAYFPGSFTGQLGYLPAPSQYDKPDLGAFEPVGTGPFVFQSFTRDVELVVARNENYWRTDEAGNQLPFLDGVTFRPIIDNKARRDAFDNKAVQLNADSFSENRSHWEDHGFFLEDPTGFQETSYLLLNNSAPPFDDPLVRKAIAHCTNYEEYQTLRAPAAQIADSPFSPGNPWGVEDTAFPEFDPELGKQLLAEAGFSGTIQYGTTPDSGNRLTAELLTQQWRDNCGIDAQIQQIEQGAFITVALTGDFQAFLWRNHGDPVVSSDYIWWGSQFGEGLATNFGRINEPAIDQAFLDFRATDDKAVLDEQVKIIADTFAEQVNNIWLNWTVWTVPYAENLHQVGKISLPDGGESFRMNRARVELAETFQAG